MRQLIFGFIAALFVGSAANAYVLNLLPGPSSEYTFDPSDFEYYNYDYGGLTTDGQTLKIDFYITSDDPNATFSHSGPTQIDYYTYFMNNIGDVSQISSLYAYKQYRWERVASPRGVVSYLARTPKYDVVGYHCDDPAYIGKICRQSFQSIFNSALITVKGNSLVTVREEFSVAPEPAMWALMISGFSLTGIAIRRRMAPRRTAG